MLSILIPIYNCPIVTLVEELIKQCKLASVEYEIICLDDGSQKRFKTKNEKVNEIFGVNYVELSENSGRSKIRNQLSKLARFPFLLFLDCDGKIPSVNFISAYVNAIAQNGDKLICGGTIYQEKPPKNPSLLLHWKYGRKRESLVAEIRNLAPITHFHSNNFVIPSKLLSETPFETNLKGYGYEDLLLAEHMKKKGYEVWHIDNPILHMGLNPVNIFLQKVKDSTLSLVEISRNTPLTSSKLIMCYRRIKTWWIAGLLFTILTCTKTLLLSNLRSTNPNLFLLDLYKLAIYARAIKE